MVRLYGFDRCGFYRFCKFFEVTWCLTSVGVREAGSGPSKLSADSG